VIARIAAAALALAACGGGEPADPDAAPVVDHDASPDAIPCTSVGDLSQPAQMQVVTQTLDGLTAPVEDGAELTLINPPQGGKILLVGVRVTNVDLCDATIQVALKDLVTARVAGLERRPVAWRIADDGFAEPAQPDQLSDYANVPVCPSASIDQDIDGNPWQLEVRFYDHAQHATEQLLTVTPSCATDPDPASCMCQCAAVPSCATGRPGDRQDDPELRPGALGGLDLEAATVGLDDRVADR
jgi:hypothetical protein